MVLVIVAVVGLLLVQVFLVPALRYGLVSERSVADNLRYTAGPRDEGEPTSPLVERAIRAERNLLETLPAFFVLAVLAHVEQADPLAVTAGWVYFAARCAYLPMYLAGVPFLRTLCFMTSLLAMLAIGYTVV